MMRGVAMVTVFFGMLTLAPAATVGTSAAQATPGPQPQSGRADMMKMHEQMMADMKAAEDRLDALVREMNSAPGDGKVNALAAVVNEMVRQQKAMRTHMDHMHTEMMGRGMMRR